MIIYVAGIPKHCSRQILFNYFSQFGSITDISPLAEPWNNCSSARDGSHHKGYCYISTACGETFSRILGYRSHILFGRGLYCTMYQEGSKLMRQNRINNQRKVILRGVPFEIDTDGLRVLLEETIGKVELMYQFKDSTISTDCVNQQPTKVRSFSVMFEEKSSALFLLNLRTISFNDSIILVEKFKPAGKRNKVKVPSANDSTSNHPEDKKSAFQQESTQANSIDNKNPHFLGIPIDFVRPTSKMYYSIRRGRSNNYQPNQMRILSSDEIRLNQQQPVLPVDRPTPSMAQRPLFHSYKVF